MNYIMKFFIVLGLAILSQIGMAVYNGAKGFSLETGAHKLSLLAVLILIIFIVGNIYLLMYLGKKLGFLTLSKDFLTKKNIIYILVGTLIARTAGIGGTLLLNATGVTQTANDETIGQLFTGENPLLIILLIGIAAPIMEEIVFRGGIVGYLFKDLPVVGIIVSSVLFGLMHSPTNIISFLIYGLIGLTCAIAYFKTRRLEVSIAIHFLNNILPALVLAFGIS
ncbi:type II CAAX endopeptidase family protein [Lactococcus lactis]|uniref:CPBP family intramembrane glutamic endopeptidase n=1 Tax=Lactococcus lactis TaxID=1358 RepID=UPI0025A09516|nr:type II CAAX endopeptidase family protein [Lactococcus lactis]MDM7545249.1 type II CAAX endopeptidase family protein [Lactococcus lactis]